MNFKSNIQDVGIVYPGEEKPVVFWKTEECKEVTSVRGGCTCTSVSNETDCIKATWKVGHALGKTFKNIMIDYADGSGDVLQIIADVRPHGS